MKSLNLSKPNILNLLVCFFPLAFILGTLFVNLVTLLIGLLGIFFYREKLFTFGKNNLLIFISSFFGLLIVSTLFEYITNNNNHLLKSILYLRYLLFLIVIRYMVLNGDLNFKQFLFSCLALSTFVAADIILQFFLGVNILGLEPIGYHRGRGMEIIHRSGVFGTEAVAGGYIQKFLILGLFSIPIIFYKSKKKILLVLILTTIIGFLGIVFSGNRMPLLLFIFFIILSLLIFDVKKFKFIKIFFVFFIFSLFALLLNKSENLKKNYFNFYGGLTELSKIPSRINKNYPELEKYKNTQKPFHETEGINNIEKYKMLPNFTGHTSLYITSIDIFRESPFMGRGIKSFRNACKEFWHLPNRTCQTHPHNIFLEILNDTGIFGLGFLGITLTILFIKNFNKYYRRYRGRIKNMNFLFYGVAFALLLEFIPFRSHGSFFSTLNSSYIFLLIGIFFGLYDLNLKKTTKK
jgi:hypothetical protein